MELPDDRFEERVDGEPLPTGKGAPAIECEVWLRVASDVLEIGLPEDHKPMAKSSLGEVKQQPTKIGPWERSVIAIEKDKAGGWASKCSMLVFPASERRHAEAVVLDLAFTPAGKGTEQESTFNLKAYASNDPSKRGKHVGKNGPAAGQADDDGPAGVTLEKRTCHRRVLFHMTWPKACSDKEGPARIVVTMEDCGQCPSIVRYEPQPYQTPAYVGRKVEYRPIERDPDPNDANPLKTESWQIKPPLPEGLRFCTKTGVVSGAPVAATVPKGYVVTAKNSAGDVHYQLRLEVKLGAEEQRRLLEQAWRRVKFPPIDLPATKRSLEDSITQAMKLASWDIERVVAKLPDKCRMMKAQVQSLLPRALEFNRELAAVASFGRRTQLVVPRDYRTIQEAVQAAHYAKETPHIWVLPGQYDDPVRVRLPITIEGTAPGVEILCAGEPCVEFEAGGEHAVFRNITCVRTCLGGQCAPGPCIIVKAGRPQIEQCRVASDMGTCIELHQDTDALVQESVIFPSYDRHCAGIVALPHAKGRVTSSVFAAEGMDMDIADTAKVRCERNTAKPIYTLDTPQCFEIDGVFGEPPYFTTSIISRERKRFLLDEEDLEGKELSAGEVTAHVWATSSGLSWPATKKKRPPRTFPQIAVGSHNANPGWNERQLVTEWNPGYAFTQERRHDEVMRQSALEPVGRAPQRARGPVLRSILTAPWERGTRGPLKSCMSQTVRCGPPIRVERAASTGSLYTDYRDTKTRQSMGRYAQEWAREKMATSGWSEASLATGDRFSSRVATGDRFGTGTNPLTGGDRSPNRFGSEWRDDHSCRSPVSTTSPTSPTRSRYMRTKSESSTLLADAGKARYKSERMGGDDVLENPLLSPEHRRNPAVHPTAWDHPVMWDTAPAVRLPQRAPGPTTLKMRGVKQPSDTVKLDLLKL